MESSKMMVAPAVLARLYDFPAASLRENVQSGNYNKSYRFSRSGEDHILRISPANDDRKVMQQRMAYLQAHFRLGSPVVEPVASVNDNLVEAVQVSGGEWHLVTVAKVVPGVTYELVNESAISSAEFFALGKALACLHNNSAAIDTTSTPPHWHEVSNCFTVEQPEAFEDADMVKHYLKAREECLALPQEPAGYGVIHGDLHFSNAIIDHSNVRITICDFDDTCMGHYAMDVAMLVFDLGVILQCEDKESLLARMSQEIIGGYNSVTRQSKIECADIDPFLRLLDASLYIQYHAYYASNPDQGGWLKFFFAGRQRK